LIVIAPTILAFPGPYPQQTQQESQQAGVFLIYFIITGVYLCKRWRLLGPLTSRAAAPVARAM